MEKPPSAIIIARHGARLDSADKQWHLTSPAPYDPPLSYGGWLQSRSLGARIISLLQSPLDPESASSSQRSSHAPRDSENPNSQAPTPKQKRRIIIHTSPYLRCLQTAIAVSAGVSQYHRDPDSRATETDGGHTGHRCLLRVDACLGEWLTPGYFEEIIPPPSSDRLVVAAKAELLHRGENIPSSGDTGSRPATGYFPGGWGSFSNLTSPDVAKTPPLSAQSNRNRAASYHVSNTVTNPRAKGVLTKINTNVPHDPNAGYVPPTPGYAISSSDPIPSGYVAHARDACTKVDYQWDSMRRPQNWGNGGNYGEEWSSMHSRFRHSLRNMVDWYRDHDRPPQFACNGESRLPRENEEDGDDEEASETVLVIVTHGAGCNALIGALTGEPVLVDVGTASLTMAVPKAVEGSPSVDVPQEYSLESIASTDHLRPGFNPSDSSILASPKPPTFSPIPSYRHRLAARPPHSQSPFIIGPSPTPGSTARESSTSRPSTASHASPGLWGQDGGTDSTDDIVPNFGRPDSPAPSANSRADSPRDGTGSEGLEHRTLSQPGLWGSAPLNQEREVGMRRRWTVTDRRI
ncbi:phosphoglycerate mutase family protein [Aspergillus sp. HF37]|nr:phosphoglycerate mutase family protein [Aspergillus sp. HF37]